MAVGKLAALAVAAAIWLPLATPAQAQIYPGWDFGGGIGIGIGPPPSAYTPCPNYGWWYYPYGCAYGYRPAYSYPYRPARRAHHKKRTAHAARQY